MLTRCPACATHFRVTPEQLKARSGRVRCGECQQVFNALDTLIEEPVLTMAPVARPSVPAQRIPASSADSMAEAAGGPETVADELTLPPAAIPDALEVTEKLDSPQFAAEESTLPDMEQAPPQDPAGSEELPTSEPGVATPEPDDQMPAESVIVVAEPANGTPAESIAVEAGTETVEWSETFPEPLPASRRWPWVVGSLIALIAIGLQCAMAFRVELAVLWPEGKPALVALCDIAGCEVGLPAKVGLVGIEASDLHPDTTQPGRLALTATLKNRAPFAQQFPHLELTLTDTADKAVARKVLTPADYLPAKSSVADGMPSSADVSVTVGVDARDMAASGYRLYLFYP